MFFSRFAQDSRITTIAIPITALLTGFMAGSLVKIWPWQQILQGVGDKAVTRPILPDKYTELYGQNPQVATAIIMAVIGIAIVVILESWANREKNK